MKYQELEMIRILSPNAAKDEYRFMGALTCTGRDGIGTLSFSWSHPSSE